MKKEEFPPLFSKPILLGKTSLNLHTAPENLYRLSLFDYSSDDISSFSALDLAVPSS